MIRFPLGLRPSPATPRDAAGWFLGGMDVEAWLGVLAEAGVSPERAVFRVVGREGVLVTVAGVLPAVRPARAVAYAVRAGKLFLPVEAALEPEVTDAELAGLPGEVAVLHPSAGLVAFEPTDGHRAAALFARPVQRETEWSGARPGVAPLPRLRAVEPLEPPSLEILLRESRGDIGTSRPEELPPAPDEKKTGTPEGSWLGRQVAKGVEWLTGLAPATAGEPTWVDRLRKWSTDRLGRPGAPDLEDARSREIRRLLNMLDSDPDQGLKFALPLGGNGARGLARPGSTLGPHDTNFDLGRLAGGQPVDPWNLNWKTQQELAKRYRELALRELRLGRHRRAAYVFAELLGDVHSAADALQQGRHFREAAVLYRDRIKNPLLAAACLEKGGLLPEAIAIYESERRWETAGDLYARIERPDEAARAWREAVRALQEKGDVLGAGKLLEGKLAAPDEALAGWSDAWPWSQQAGACLEAKFELLGRLGRHDEAKKSVDALRDEPPVESRTVTLARALAGVSAMYPDRRLRDRAADALRVVAGRRLPRADAAETQQLLRAICQVAPDDRLLSRDATRFTLRFRARATPVRAPRSPVLLLEFSLPRDVSWSLAAARRDVFYAAGYLGAGIVLARASWDGVVQLKDWRLPAMPTQPLLLEPSSDPLRPVLLGFVGGPRLEVLQLPASDGFPQPNSSGTPPWFPDEVLAVACSDISVVWIAREHLGRLVVWAYTHNGSISAIYPLPQLEEALPEGASLRSVAPLPAVASHDHVHIALGTRVARVGRGGQISILDLPHPVLSLRASSTHACIVAIFESGGALFADAPDPGTPRLFGDDLGEPIAAFTHGGELVALSERDGRVFDVAAGRAVERAKFTTKGGRPVAVVRGSRGDEFAVLTVDGVVQVWKTG